MLFWIVAVVLAAAVAGLIAYGGLRVRDRALEGEAADVPVYRAQLAEVDRDRARGVIGEGEAERLRNEIARRLLAADAAARQAAASGRRAPPLVLGGVALVIVALTLGLYTWLGTPGYGDMPLKDRLARAEDFRQSRPSQTEIEADIPPRPTPELPERFADLMEKLRSAVENRPDDLQGLRLLARNEARVGDFQAAYEAQEKILNVLGDEAGAQDYLDYGEYLIMAAGGYVSPKAENALRAALSRKPDNPVAQYYIGLMWRQTGRPDIAFRIWDRLLRQGPEEAPWIPAIRARIDEAAQLAGVEYEQPRPTQQTPAAPPMAGPSAEDMEAAQDMSAEDRQEMIRGMVSRLADRLANEGGPAEEWARLIGAYGVLGETERARAIRDEALQVFAGREDDLAQIRAAAERAGLDG